MSLACTAVSYHTCATQNFPISFGKLSSLHNINVSLNSIIHNTLCTLKQRKSTGQSNPNGRFSKAHLNVFLRPPPFLDLSQAVASRFVPYCG